MSKNKFKLKQLFLSSLFFYGLTCSFSVTTYGEQFKELNDDIFIDRNYLTKFPENEYILGPGDVIKIIVSREYPELDSTERINEDGTIYLPKLYKVLVKGLTIDELNKVLDDAFSEFVKYPSAEVSIVEYRPISVYVNGEVENPGFQQLEGSLSLISRNNSKLNISGDFQNNNYFPTVFDAIRARGGITRFSDLESVEIKRINKLSSGGGKKTTTLNLKNALFAKDTSQNIRIYDSDVITIKKLLKPDKEQLKAAISSDLNQKFINIFVSGRVNMPGKIQVSRISSLNEAIEMAGGAKALKGSVRFVRFKNDGSIDTRTFRYQQGKERGSYENPILRGGDVIHVGRGNIASISEVVSEVTSPLTGVFSTYGLIKAISD